MHRLPSLRYHWTRTVSIVAADVILTNLRILVTFLRISVASVELTWSAELVSVHLHVPQGLRMVSNDLAGNNHQKVTSLSVPKVVIRFLHALGKKNDWAEAGEVVFDVALDNYSSPSGWKEGALAQAKFLAKQDQPTGRLRKLKIGLGKKGRAMPSASVSPSSLGGAIRA